MKPLLAPRPCTVVRREFNPAIRSLEVQRMETGLTPEQEAALEEHYAQAEQAYRLSQQDVDAMAKAEEAAEGRVVPFPVLMNFHD